ncbi:hypoxanthine phosphoribosyltransferase [Candidatus Saccharibacteria bacterium]|nr:hypoxanthine phosphoribosyltransferase [Candidatus Saccharibacteria bacterium]
MQVPTEYISENRLRHTVATLADTVAKDIDNDWVVLVLLRGSFIFAADFVRELARQSVYPSIDFMNLQSYHQGTESNGVKVTAEPAESIKNKSVLILDDIFDTGLTMSAAITYCQKQQAKKIKSMVLFEKPSRRVMDLEINYAGLTIENKFIVGYGLDYANRYRSLPYIAVI